MTSRSSRLFVALLPRITLGSVLWMLAAPAPADEMAPARDCFGDPLPTGASARLGTVRLRHADNLMDIAFTPDGKTIVSVGWDGVRVFETATGKRVRHFGAGLWPRSASLSADGKYIALARHSIGASGSPVFVWNVATGALLHTLGNGDFALVRFSPDGTRLAALENGRFGNPYGRVEIWDAATGQRLSGWKGRKESVADMRFSSDGKQLLLGGSHKMIVVHDTASGKEVRRLGGLPADADHLIVSPRGDRAAFIELSDWRFARSPTPQENAYLLDLKSNSIIRSWTVKNPRAVPKAVKALTFAPDGNRLAVYMSDGPIHLWDLQSSRETLLRPENHAYWEGLAFSPDGRTLAVGNGSRVIRLLAVDNGADRLVDNGPQGPIRTLAVAADGRTAFTAAEDGTIHRWDVRTGRQLGRFAGDNCAVVSLALTADGRVLCSLSSNGTLRLWDVNTGKDRRLLEDRNVYIARLALSPDGKTLAMPLAHPTELLLLNPLTGECRHRLATKAWIAGAAFMADASVVMALTGERKIYRWETATGRRLRDLLLPPDPDGPPITEPHLHTDGESMVLSLDGRWVAHAFNKKFLRLLDVSRQREAQRTANLPDSVASIAFAADGRSLAWAEESGIIHWLELATWSERRTFSGHASAVRQMAFTRDGRRLISGSEDTTVLVWDLLERGPATLSAYERGACWTDLADKDAAKAYRAVCRLLAAPADALALLQLQLKPVEGVDEKRIERLIADLDSDAFTVREKATTELRKLGELAEPLLRKALAARPALEMNRRLQGLLDDASPWRPSAEILRQLRAIEVLERLGTPVARTLLEALAKGVDGARLTRESRTALRRQRR